MATESTRTTSSNQGTLYRWTIDNGDVVQVDLRFIETIDWAGQSLVAEISSAAGATTAVQYTLDTDDATFDDAAPPTDWWRSVVGPDGSTAVTVPGGTTRTVNVDAAINGLRVAPTGGSATLSILSPVDLTGAITQPE